MKIVTTVFLMLLSIPLFSFKQGDVVYGFATRVLDGNTMLVTLKSGNTFPLRLNTIKAPGLKEYFGPQSHKFLSDMVSGKLLEIHPQSVDDRLNYVCTVFVEGRNVNLTMVELGYAKYYKWLRVDPDFEIAHEVAKLNRIGMWQ